MSFTEWSNAKKKKEEEEKASKSTSKTTSGSTGSGNSGLSFTEWSNLKTTGSTITGYNDKDAYAGWQAFVERQKAKRQQEEEKSWFEKMIGYLGPSSPDSTLPMSTMTIVQENYSKDTSYREPTDKWTERQKKDFGFLYAKNPNEAWRYAEKVNTSIAKEETQKQKTAIAESATDGFWKGAAHTAGAILSAPLGLADYLDNMAEYNARGKITEKAGVTPFEYSQTVTGSIANDLNGVDMFGVAHNVLPENIPIIGGKGWGDVYGLGTSIAQSALAGYAGGQAGTLVQFFGSAAAAGIDDAKQRGASDDQALKIGTLSGAAEGLAEMVGVDNLLKIGSASTMRQLMKNLVKQGAAEGLEEGITTLMNNFADQIVMQDKSNFYILVQSYMAQGMSEEEAKKKAWQNMANDMAFDMVAGFASGAIHAGPQTTYQTVMENVYQPYQTGKYIMESEGSVDALKQLANDVAGVSSADMQKRLTEKTGKVDEKQSALRVGKLYETVQSANNLANASANQADIAKSLERKGFTSETANTIAEALVAKYNGQELTKAQEKILKSAKGNSAVQDAISNIMNNTKSTMGQRSDNIRTFNRDVNIGRIARANGMSADQVRKIAEGNLSGQEESLPESHYEVSADGKTIDADGNVVNIKGIASIQKGKLILETENGTVDAGTVAYSSNGEAMVYEAVSNLEGIIDTDTANRLSKHLLKLGEASSDVYVKGIVQAYTYGFYGYGREAMNGENTLSSTLSEKQRNVAYGLGEQYRNAKTTADQAKARNATVAKKNATVVKENATAPDGTQYKNVRFDGKVKKWSAKQKAEVEFIDFIASNFSGNTVHVFESYKTKDGRFVYEDSNGKVHAAPNGMYIESTGDIYLDLNAGTHGEGLILNTFAHELYHHIQKQSPEKARKLAEFLVQELGYESVEAAVDRQIKKAESAGHGVAYFMEESGLSRSAAERMVYDRAFNDFVADSLETMFTEGDAVSKLQKLKNQDRTLFDMIQDFINKWVKKLREFYSNHSTISIEGDMVAHLEKFEQIQQMFVEALVDAGENFQSLMTVEENTDAVAVEEVTQYSYRSLAEAAGFEAVENEDGTRSFLRNGVKVSKVTVDDIEHSPIGAFINYSLAKNDISEKEAIRQKKMFADICTMACKTNDFSMTMQFVGSAVFTGMKANADKQYGTTYDFPSICTKTQAVIDAMSKRMVSLGRGLSSDELVKLYQDVFASGNPVPCPECYVFSRWIGIGGLLDNIKKYQDYYGDMKVEDVAKAYRTMRDEVAAFAEEQGISFGKAKGALTSKLTKEYNKLTEKIEKAENQGEKVKPADRKRLEELEPMMNTVKGMTWLENVYFADSSLKKVNPRFRVPNEVLFDLNNGEAFATEYKEAWAFRTTQGAGYGKAITPYAEARLGEGILVTNNTTNAIKGKAQGSLDNFFLRQNGTLDKKAREALDRARVKQKIQAFIGGQRFQSTSDARYENASDYLLAALEMQAMHGMVQVYTKVDGAVPAFSAWGFSINQSLMPLGGGLDERGNVKDTSVGGMNRDIAFRNREKHETAGTITIGVNDNHIRAMFKQWVRDFIIPYHASGGKADVVAAFRSIQEGQEKRGQMVRSTDYSRTQGDKVLSDEVLRWQGKTEAEIQRIHDIRANRIAILTGGKIDMDVVRSNRFLSALYDKIYNGEWKGVKLAKSKVESQIFPNEFWDQSVSYEESGKVTRDYLEYCNDLGFLHRFSGMVPSNGKLVSVKGYDQNGNRVELTDLAYKYDENGQKTDQIEEYFWKVLTDRRMYDNQGKYLPQKVVTLNDTTEDTVTSFAKGNYGRQYDKALSMKTAEEIAGKMYSERDLEAAVQGIQNDVLTDDANAIAEQVTDVVNTVLFSDRDQVHREETYSAIGKELLSYEEGNKKPDLTLVETVNERTGKTETTIKHFGQKPKGYIPKRIAYCYKLFEQHPDGTLHALFAGAKGETPVGVWQYAQGFPYTDAGVKGMNLRERYGWHLSAGLPAAPHLMSPKDFGRGYPSKNSYGHPKGSKRVWVRMAYDASTDFNAVADSTKEGDIFGLIPFGGYYAFKENNQSEWVISSAVKIDKILEEDERQQILRDAGFDEYEAWRKKFRPTEEEKAESKRKSAENKKAKDKAIKAGLNYLSESSKAMRESIKSRIIDNPEIMYSDRDNAPTFYSHMARVVAGVKQEKLGAASVVSMLRGKGVKAEEIKWSGIEEWLAGKKSVTKAELQEFIAGSMLQIEEETLTNEEIPYTEDQQNRIDEHTAKRDEIAQELSDAWKEITGDAIPITNFGAGLESSVESKIRDVNLEYKKAAFEGRLLEKLRKDLKEVIANNDDFGFDSWKEALVSIHRNRRSFIDHYEMSTADKAVIVKYCNALNAYNELPNKINDLDTGRLRRIAHEADLYNRKIGDVRSEHYAENAKHMTRRGQYKIKGGENYREVLFKIPGSSYYNDAMAMHWDERNGVLAHARIQDLNTFLGKMLFIEEIQSDWHNEGHKEGYNSDREEALKKIADLREQWDSLYNDMIKAGATEARAISKRMDAIDTERANLAKKVRYGNFVPDAPFKDTYHEYVLKRLLRMAAEEGYDSIGWTPAEIQVKRWSEEFAEGYRIEYDQDIPKFLNKYGKKWGTKVGKTVLDNGTEIWSMAITDEMTESVLTEGQPLFSYRDEAPNAFNPEGKTLDEQLDEILKSAESFDGRYLYIGRFTPAFIDMVKRYVDIKDLPIAMNYRDAYLSMESEENGRYKGDGINYHNLGKKGMKSAIESFDRPEQVLLSKKDGKIELVLEGTDRKGNRLLSIVALNTSTRNAQKFIEAHIVTSIYGKRSIERYVSKAESEGRLIYTKKEEPAQGISQVQYEGNINANSSSEVTVAQDLTDVNMYSDRDSESVSNRSLLANAFEGVAQNDIERNKIREYRDKIDLINEEERKLAELNQKIKDLSFSKGPKDTKAIKDLQFEAKQTANRINTYDSQLLRLEASKPLQAVLAREKQKAYKRAEKKGKEALEAYRERAAKTQRELLDRYQESRKKATESREKTAMRHKIQSVVGELNDLLLNESKKRHVPDSLKKAVADALALVNMDTVGAEERAAKYAALIARETDPDKIDAYTVTMENILRHGEKMGQRLKELRDAYEEIQDSDDPDIANAYDPVIAGSLKELASSIGNTSLRNMTIEQLSDVYDMYRMVLTRVREANKTLMENIKENISNLASRVIGEVRISGGEHKYRAAALDPVRKFLWNNLKPVYAMEHIGSGTLTKVFDNVRSGEDTWAKDVTEAREFYLDKAGKFGYDSWDFKKKYSFESNDGTVFELTLEQILSLYAYSKREQAADHLRLGGFVFDSNIETYKEKDGKTGKSILKYRVNTADAHQITPEILMNITGKLSDNQKAFVDEMQGYLSTVMGAKGNEVTMKMYGVKLFKEKFYFPLKSAKQFMFEQNEVSGEVKIKNSGFTNKVVAKANNPVILSNFMDVWSGHVNDMSMYHAFVLPLEDFNRVFNYNSPKKEGQPPVSVKGTIQNAYSPAAVNYVKGLITDLNGGARGDSTTGIINKMMGLFKKGSVFASLSVVVQQPSAIARAAALVDTKYFIGAKVDHKRHKLLWEEVKKYAPVAIIKEMGYFDTNMGKSTQDFIVGKEYSGIKEKMKALVTDSGYRDEVLSKAPALADELAWCSIWEAVKRETKAQYPGLDAKSEPFLMLAGSRFTEVITKTQVYDSVLARSANMRSKDTGMKMATAFMAEPTTSINMIADALLQGKRGKKRYARAAIGAVIASQIFNAILVSFVYAGRDDDEDKTYWEKYIGTLSGEIIDSLNPAGYIPFIKDIQSIVQGYDVERSDMAVISDLWKAWENLSKDNVSVYRKVEGFAGSIAQIFGLPVKNIMRDVRGIWQTIESFMNGQQTTKAGIGYAVKSALPGWMGGGDTTDQNQLYEAMLSGDKAQIARVKGRYKDQSAINSAIRKGLRENDPRIKQAAQAKFNGNLSEYTKLAKAIIGEKHFSQDDVVAAINAEINLLDTDKATSSTQKASGLYKSADFATAIVQGNSAMANAIKTDIIQTAMKNGKTESEAQKSFSSTASGDMKELYLEGKLSESAAMDALVTYCGADQEDAEERVASWVFEKQWGFTYSDRVDAYLEGKVTESELRTLMAEYGGMTELEVDNNMTAYNWMKRNPEYDLSVSEVLAYTKTIDDIGISIEGSGIDPNTFVEYRDLRSQCKGVDADGDGSADRNTVKNEVLLVIDALPISNYQKDVLYYLNGWAASKLWQAPWH